MLFLVLRPLQLTTWIRIISKRYSICSGRNVKNNHINQVLSQFKIKKYFKNFNENLCLYSFLL